MTINSRGGRAIYILRVFFPLQLIFGHLKYNLVALIYWLILFLIVADRFGSRFGIPFLFYSPEYRGEISWASFALIGFSIGGFTMAFNMYSYMVLGRKYPFLATLSRPFIKFCWNNAVIPIVFNVYYIIKFSAFQSSEEFATTAVIWSYILAYLMGFLIFVFGSILYFFPTNKDFFKLSGKSVYDDMQEEPVSSFFHKSKSWGELFRYEKDRSYIYMSGFARWRKSRSIHHYDKDLLERVFAQNRINASLFEIVTILSFVILGLFRESPLFELPAGMSIVLLLAIILMLFSVLMSWFRYWTYPVLIFLVLLMNYLSGHSPLFQFRNYAYGLSYDHEKAHPYSIRTIYEHANDTLTSAASRQNYLEILEEWKKQTGEAKPKLVVLICSGGGSRSALWTFSVLQKADKRLNGKLSCHMQMMTGASGGMIGAAYFRSLLLEEKRGNIEDRFDPSYLSNISRDLLNKLSVSAYTTDLFVRYQKVKIAGHTYTKDRGYAFEQQLNNNTKQLMNKPISYFGPYERQAIIPTMILSPTIVNDGRRLLISSQSMAFLCHNASNESKISSSYENIDFQSFFTGNTTDSLRFTSALRMSATFPFILPMVSMPTTPEMQLMDAGIRDNYGGKTMLEFLFQMEDWIEQNTSGVVILQIRDTKKILKDEEFKPVSLSDKFTMPFGNMYDNFPRTQDFDQDMMMKLGFRGFSVPVDLVSFNLREAPKDRISLSWHLTKNEKMKILKAFTSLGNENAMRQLEDLLK